MPKASSTTARGYGHEHMKQRAKWKPIVASGQAQCHATLCLMPNRWIAPGSTWDLGHTPDRSTWTGPEHSRCNRSEGAVRRNAKHRQKRIAIPRWII